MLPTYVIYKKLLKNKLQEQILINFRMSGSGDSYDENIIF